MTFKRGVSGNPSGRPRGSGTAARLRKRIEADAEGIIDSLISAAQSGDATAARIVLDKVLPNLRPVDSPVRLKMTGSLAEQSVEVLQSISSGKLTPDEGAKVMSSIKTAAAVAEITDLAERVRILEEKQ